MVSPQVMLVVIGYHVRRKQALILTESTSATLMIDTDGHGTSWSHRRALEWAVNQPCRVVMLEDDAMPVAGFCEKIAVWFARYPGVLCSFYLGTGRPPQYQLEIVSKLVAADKVRVGSTTLPRLIHGVCCNVPQQHIKRVLDKWNHSKVADYAAGGAYGGPVVYPYYLLVDHTDGQPIEQVRDNQPKTGHRKAWRLNV